MKIVLTGGGTAGHVNPHFPILAHLTPLGFTPYYVGEKGGIEERIAKEKGIPFYGITCSKLRRSLTLKNLAIPFLFPKSVLEAKKVLSSLSPDVVFSKGGYVSLPVVIAAKSLGIPAVIHESDYSVGLANRIASRYAVKTLTSFENAALEIKNARCVGAPIAVRKITRTDELYRSLHLSPDLPTLLVFGGSLGARAINETVYRALPALTKTFQVLHVVGEKNVDETVRFPRYVQLPYVKEMEKAYAVADVVVSRAGAGSVFEIASLSIPAVFIPLSKKVSRGDQLQNAAYFSSRGFGSVLSEENLTEDSLVKAVKDAYEHPVKPTKKIADASKKIADEIVNAVKDYS